MERKCLDDELNNKFYFSRVSGRNQLSFLPFCHSRRRPTFTFFLSKNVEKENHYSRSRQVFQDSNKKL